MSDTQTLAEDVRAGKRRALAKAITLVESTRADHREQARALVEALLPATGRALRVGLSGVPGVGKSTFVEALGLYLIEQGHRVAVLAVDPSSSVHGGSILGDKTRMELLSRREQAFIRPSPAGGALGGVANRTREAMLVCEAAGFDVVLVETVGVGQSEIAVAGMTALFCLLQLPNAGYDLQGMKKGIVEIADIVAINKADIDVAATRRAQAQMHGAIGMVRHAHLDWTPPVIPVSALKAEGIDAFWNTVLKFRERMQANGAFEARRRRQSGAWMWELIDQELRARFRANARVAKELPGLQAEVEQGQVTPAAAAARLLGHLDGGQVL